MKPKVISESRNSMVAIIISAFREEDRNLDDYTDGFGVQLSNGIGCNVYRSNQTGSWKFRMAASKLQLLSQPLIHHFRLGRKSFQQLSLGSWTPKNWLNSL